MNSKTQQSLLQFLFYLGIIGIICILVFPNLIESFHNATNATLYPRNGLWMSTRNTRNMSYDLRGDPVVIPPNFGLSPWGISPRLPLF